MAYLFHTQGTPVRPSLSHISSRGHSWLAALCTKFMQTIVFNITLIRLFGEKGGANYDRARVRMRYAAISLCEHFT